MVTVERQQTVDGDPRLVCPQCGRPFKELTRHWGGPKECTHPPFSERQREIVKGLTMGDGSISKPRGNGDASMKVLSTNERYLRWLRAQFGVFASEVRLSKTGEELGENARQYESFDDSGGDWEYQDIYCLRIRSHPTLTEMRARWYPDDTIRYPDDLRLTPTAAKLWYVSDGGLSWSSPDHAHAAFGTHNEGERSGFLCRLFEDHGFSPSWSEPLVRFSIYETPELLGWMGAAPVGFAYKWECGSRALYDRLKAEVCGDA